MTADDVNRLLPAPIGSRVRRLHRFAVFALAAIAVIVAAGTAALEGTFRYLLYTREVLKIIRTTQTTLVDREVLALDARMQGRDVRADSAGHDRMRQAALAFDSLLVLTADDSEQQVRVRRVQAAAVAWDSALVATLAGPVSPTAAQSLAQRRNTMRSAFANLLLAEEQAYQRRALSQRLTRLGLLLLVLVAIVVIWFAMSRFVRSLNRQIGRASDAQRDRDVSMQRLSFVLDNAPFAVAIVAPDDRVELENPAWRTLGFDVDQRLSPAVSSTADTHLTRLHALVAAARINDRMEVAELRETAPDGSPLSDETARIWMANAYPIRGGAEGYTERVGLVVLDVTERRRLELRLRHGHRLEALGQLAGGVAHDFNNILTAVIGFTELVYSVLPDQGRMRADLRQVRRAADRAAMLTRQLLAFSRQQVLQPRPLLVGEVVHDLEPMLRRVIGSHITLHVDSEGDLWPVYIDPGQLEQVIVNLVINARDALADGGRITVSMQNVTLSPGSPETPDAPGPRSTPSDVRAGEYVSVRIHDTGAGIPEAVRQRMFEPFFTTKPVGKGTGLGLATVLGIVRQVEGFVEVESAEGMGTTFTVLLPHRPGQVTHIAANSIGSPARAQRASGTVLVIDDDRDVRQLIEYILTEAGYTVSTATNGLDALTLLRRSSVRWDLVITDLVMPGLGGLALERRLREEERHVPVLFVSGYASDTHEHLTVLPVDAHFLAKPFTPGQLLEAAARAIGGTGGEQRA